jgi:hypothetical protein
VAGGGASTLTTGLADLLMWLVGIISAVVVVAGVLFWRFRRVILRPLVQRHVTQADVMAEKRAELVKIRAMRLQLEAARIAGVPITADMLAMAEDPELAQLVQAFRASVNRTDQWSRPEYAAIERDPGQEVTS